MPRLSVWMVRTALVCLLTGFAIGAVLLTQVAFPVMPPMVDRFRPLHVELLTLGWIVNLGFGVGYWILPRLAAGAGRGAELPVLLAFVLLNAGVVAVGLGQGFGAELASLLGRMAEGTAAALFARHAWLRVRSSLAEGSGVR